jgi:hypothetical protein
MTNNIFIGKGKQSENGRIMVSINLTEAVKLKSSYKEKDYLRCFVTEMKTPDQYGHTHTVFAYPAEAPAAEKKSRKKK